MFDYLPPDDPVRQYFVKNKIEPPFGLLPMHEVSGDQSDRRQLLMSGDLLDRGVRGPMIVHAVGEDSVRQQHVFWKTKLRLCEEDFNKLKRALQGGPDFDWPHWRWGSAPAPDGTGDARVAALEWLRDMVLTLRKAVLPFDIALALSPEAVAKREQERLEQERLEKEREAQSELVKRVNEITI